MDGSQPPAPRRRPTEGGYARGQETRERIIRAALVVFADEGYVGASTRRIAAEAGVNPPALQYYFDSKEGLHRACGQFIVDQVMAGLSPALERARAALACGRDEAVEALCELLDGLAVLSMDTSDFDNWHRFMGRCEADDIGPASSVVEAGIAEPMKGVVIELVAHALDLAPNDPVARVRAFLIMGQISVLHTKRDRMLEAMGWTDFNGEGGALVRTLVADHVRKLTART